MSKRITIRVSDAMHRAIESAARAKNTTVGQWIRDLLSEATGRSGELKSGTAALRKDDRIKQAKLAAKKRWG